MEKYLLNVHRIGGAHLQSVNDYYAKFVGKPNCLAAIRSKVVLLLLLIRCWLLLTMWDSVTVLCFVVRYFVYILVLQSS